MPKVSVLTAVYNGDRYLAEAIESVLAQTFRDFEFLIVDDGSTDRSREIVESYRDPRIRLVVNERNLGLAPSLNRGLMQARGAYVARQDADDLSEPERLARQVEFLDTHSDVGLVGSWYTEIDAEGAVLGVRTLPRTHDQLAWSLWFSCPFVHSAVMFPLAVVPGQVGPYDETLSYSMDYELWGRIAGRYRVANLGEPLIRLRTNPWSMTATYGERANEGLRRCIANLATRLDWDCDDPPTLVRRIGVIRALTTAQVAGHSPSDLQWAVGEVSRLELQFYRERRMTAARRWAFRGWLHRVVGSGLMEAALRARRDGSTGDALGLAASAARWHAPAAGRLARRTMGR